MNLSAITEPPHLFDPSITKEVIICDIQTVFSREDDIKEAIEVETIKNEWTIPRGTL